jgi:hypothetical protein
VGDARLLGGGRGIDIAKDLDEIVLGSVRTVREGQDADKQREERDEGKEDLVRDGAGEKRAIVCREAHDDGSAARKGAGYDDASLFGELFSAGFAFVSGLASDLVSDLLSDFVSDLVSDFVSLFSAGRLSVLYQPEPLNTTAVGEIKRRGFLPQFGHFSTGWSL